jgi:hypothetical protein
LLESEAGIGVVDDRDLNQFLPHLADAVGMPLTTDEQEVLALTQPRSWQDLYLAVLGQTLKAQILCTSDVSDRFGFNPDPKQAAGEEECY